MSQMTPEKAKELREPFPPESVGKLPKPYQSGSPKGNCRECGGYHGLPAVHLDYVGHAATTHRLLQVDPQWTWEPLATDERGLPALDAKGNLWIKLTVCGVTRIGVGDGKNAKEVIGDAIRNAAMRFGVALDLWAKEDLWAMSVERGEHRSADDPGEPQYDSGLVRALEQGHDPRPHSGQPFNATDKQLKMMGALFTKAGIKDRDERLALVSQIIGHAVASAKDLTGPEASKVIDAMQKRPQTPVGRDDPGRDALTPHEAPAPPDQLPDPGDADDPWAGGTAGGTDG